MNQLIYCITDGHDWRASLLAVAICLVGVGVTLRLMERARFSEDGKRRKLAIAAGVMGALSIWASHSVAVLGYSAGAPVSYDPLLTLASILVALAMAGLAIAAALAGDGRLWRVTGALIAMTGAGAVHYLGMAALQAPVHIEWSEGFVAASVAGSLAIAGATAFFHRRAGLGRFFVGVVGFSLAILALHYVGMAAIIMTPDPTMVERSGLAPASLQALAAAVTLTVIGFAAALIFMAYAARTAARRRIREAVDAMPDGLAFFDAEDRLVLWNARYSEVNPELAPHLKVGLTFRDLLQIGVDESRYPEAIGREDAWIDERIKVRQNLSCSMEQMVASERWLRVQDRRTAEGGTVTVCNDITDLKRDAQALADARDAAEAANVAKSQFLANMSHEIRTPLNGVIGLAQAMAKTDLDANQREMLELMQASGRSLQTLLSDILDLARVESGKLELTEDAFNLSLAVREAAQLYAENARDKHLGFHVDVDLDDGLWVRGDVVRLKQVLTNLVSNAIKFTSQGFVGLTVQRGQGADGRATLRFTVEDTGIGFDAATRDRLFQRFEQADGAITRKFGGSGLGLSICRQLAEMMGGDLDCESEPGGGSAFILTVPLVECEAPTARASAAEVSRADRPARVLVADDHPTNRRVIELILAQSAAEVVMVENGAQAAETFRAGSFDLVLMDMQMPVMDGLTATREIRLHEVAMGQAPTPIVMLTANAMPEHVAAGRAAGADHHLAKPFNAAELLALVADPASLFKDRAAAA